MEITELMLSEAMKAAVAHGLVPKYCAGEDAYIKAWDSIEAVLRAALSATHPKD
jgi:hypothetical protein